MKLKPDILLKIRKNKHLRAVMVLELNITHSTLYRWLQFNSIMLTTADCLDIISKHLNVPSCDLYEREVPEPINN